MYQAGVPTAAFGVFDDLGAAEAFIDAQPGPVVVKADGLAAGKGVVVAATKDEAKLAARHMLTGGAFGAAGHRVVLEERLTGREVSLLALCDGERLALLPSSEDHKTVRDGDQGPEHRRHGDLLAVAAAGRAPMSSGSSRRSFARRWRRWRRPGGRSRGCSTAG